MIFTSSYKKCYSKNSVSISGDKGKKVDYKGESFTALAPKLSFWQQWHDNIGKFPEEENNYFYIKSYYDLVLKKLDANEVFKKLNNKILLCYENNMEFCHRHIVAAWLELELDTTVPEIVTDKFGNMTIVNRPDWIKEMLENVIEKEKEPNHVKQFIKKFISKFEGE